MIVLIAFSLWLLQAWIYEAIGGLSSAWVVKTKKKIPRIVQLMPMASLKINFAEVYSFFNDDQLTVMSISFDSTQ